MMKRIALALLLACAPTALAAPPPKAAKPAATKPAPAKPQADAQTVTITDGDYILGSPGAKVTLVEYGAPTCPYCKQWHDTVYMQIKRDYIDTGKVRFAWRELPSHNPPVDAAIFAIARCAAKEKYFAVIDEAFKRQADIEAANKAPDGALPKLKALAGDFGVTPDKFIGPCLDSPALAGRLDAVRQMGARDKVEGTPSLLIDGRMTPDAALLDYKAIRGLIDAALAAAH